jgi:hypothetical protein
MFLLSISSWWEESIGHLSFVKGMEESQLAAIYDGAV